MRISDWSSDVCSSDLLGSDSGGLLYSLLLGANAGGALTAGIVLESRSLLPARRSTAFVLVFLWALAMGGFAATGDWRAALALLFVAGFLDLSFNAMTQTLVQIEAAPEIRGRVVRSEEHTSELQSLMRISYAVFCLKKKTTVQRED